MTNPPSPRPPALPVATQNFATAVAAVQLARVILTHPRGPEALRAIQEANARIVGGRP